MTGETKFESNSLSKRLCSMMSVDFRRMFHSKLYYIMVCIAFMIPVLMLVMSTSSGDSTKVDPNTGIETTIEREPMTNAWQVVENISGSKNSGGSDIMNMSNVNLLYFAIAIFMCLFVSEEFKSGYSKNLFAVRAKKTDYVISKTLAGFFAGTSMVIAYFVGTILGGAIAGLSFDTGVAGIGGVISCMIAKCFLMFVFVAIFMLMSVIGKQKTWLSMILSFGTSLLLFSMIPMVTPLNSTILNVVISLIGGGAAAIGLGAVSNIILQKTSLV